MRKPICRVSSTLLHRIANKYKKNQSHVHLRNLNNPGKMLALKEIEDLKVDFF